MDRKIKPPDKERKLNDRLKEKDMLEKSCQWWLIWYLLFFCHGGAEGQLQWVVKEKVTAYGQNLTLFCPVENCCSEPAGWSVGPKTIILDVKTFSNDPSVKYHGTYDTDGFGVVIRNLFEADLNVTYHCVYGFDQSIPRYLLHGDVFKENVPDKDKEIDTTAAIVVPIVVTVVVIALIIIGIVAYCVYRSRINKKRQADEVDGQTVTYPLVQTTLVDSNPSKSSDEAVSLSKEVNNFFRLFYLCQKIATQAVRFFFDSKVPGYTLESFLKQHKSVLTSQESVYRCTKDQKAKLFPGGHVVVVSADFDFNMLYKLIRNLVTTLPAPTRGWGKQPSSGDLNEGDDIERIRYLRNFLAHSTELEICDADFSTRWIDLSQAIARLSKKGSLSTDVESMRTKSFDICIKNEIEEDIRKEQKQMCKDFAEIQKQVDANKENIADNKQNIADIKQNTADNTKDIADIKQNITDNKPSIADNKQEIHNSNTRHTTNTQSKLSNKVVLYVASQLGSDWTQVVLLLGIKQSEIEQIKMDNQGRSIEQITVALFKWRNRQNNRPEDTIKQLIEALEFPGRQDIIDNLRKKYEIY